MKTTITKAANTIVYDVQTANHAKDSIGAEWSLLDDAKRLGIVSKEFRTSYLVGTIAGIIKGTLDAGAALLAKKAPLAKDAEPEKKAARRAKVKAGEVTERTPAEQNVYLAAIKRLSRFCTAHSVKPAHKARGSAANGEAPTGKGDKDVTPKANNAATADTFIRQQTATLLAYCEKNRAMIPDAMRYAVAELGECVKAVPFPESEPDKTEAKPATILPRESGAFFRL